VATAFNKTESTTVVFSLQMLFPSLTILIMCEISAMVKIEYQEEYVELLFHQKIARIVSTGFWLNGATNPDLANAI